MTKEEKKNRIMLRSLKFHALSMYYYERYGNDWFHLLTRVAPRQIKLGLKVKNLDVV